MSVIGEMVLIACTFANMAGKNKYPDTTTDKKTIAKVSSLKLRDRIAEINENAKNSNTIGNMVARISKLLLIVSRSVGSPLIYVVTMAMITIVTRM